jgi:putative ATP-binding cassette transporter
VVRSGIVLKLSSKYHAFVQHEIFTHQMIKCILFLWRRSPMAVAAVMLANLINGISNVGILVLINIVLQGKPVSKGVLIWSFAGLCLLAALSRCSAELILTRLAQNSLFNLQMQLAGNIAEAPLQNLEELGMARLVTVLTHDLQVLTDALVLVPVTCVNLAILASGLIYLGWLSQAVLAVILGFIGISFLIYRLAMFSAAKSLRVARTSVDGLYHHFQSILAGIKELKLHHLRRQAFFSQVFEVSASAVRDRNIAGLTMSIGAGAWMQMSGLVLIGMLLLALPVIKLSMPDRISYTITLIFMVGPLQVLLSRNSGFKLAEIALQKIEDLQRNLAAFHAEMDSASQPDSEREFRHLEIADLTYAYARESNTGEVDTFALGPVSLSLVPGEVVFLAGPNGSGKTTLAKILVGLYAPVRGEIFLNGQAVTDVNRIWYRQHFSVVFADFHLFDRLLGLEKAELDLEVTGYLTQLELNNAVQVSNGIFSTTRLSQGQRKRLALLTAFIEDRPVYVFDEWAADQDPAFKKIFYHVFLPALKARGKAVLVISHDERYYGIADRIIELNDGRIIELSTVHSA